MNAPRPANPLHYVQPEMLAVEVIASQEKRRVTPALGMMLMRMAERTGRMANWRGYSFRDDMVADAAMVMCAAAMKIDMARPDCNAFVYLGRTCDHAFIACIKREKKQGMVHAALRNEAGFEPSAMEQVENEQAQRAGHERIAMAGRYSRSRFGASS